MTLIFPVADRVELLARFLAYYRKLGVTRFVCGLHNGRSNPLFLTVFNHGVDFIGRSCACPWEKFNGPAEVEGLNSLRQHFVGSKEWYAIADLDEFVVPLQANNLPDLAAKAAADGYAAVHGKFVDRIALDGSCPVIEKYKSLDDQFPLRADLANGIAVSDKVCVARGDVPIGSGHHTVPPEFKVWKNGLEVHHFKWTHGVADRLKERGRLFAAQGLPWAGESDGFLKRIQSGLNAEAVPAAPIGA